MTAMKALQNRVRGWLPKEPTLLSRETSGNDNFKLFTRRMVIAVVAGTITAALLGIIGSLLGFRDSIGGYVWTFATVMSINAGIMVYAKYTLRKLGLPAETKPW